MVLENSSLINKNYRKRCGCYSHASISCTHGISAGTAIPYRIIGIDGNKIHVQDAYGETLKYGAEAVQTKFDILKKGERTWIIHNVLSTTPTPGKCRNVHTHGVFWHGSMDFQVVIPYSIGTVSQLLMLTKECGRQVLRIPISDENGYFPEDTRCNEKYRYQILRMFE